MPAQQPDHYATLGVPPDSAFGEIQKAFFKKSISCHHDKRHKADFQEAHREFILISEAYNAIKDPKSRHKYGNKRQRQHARSSDSQSTGKSSEFEAYEVPREEDYDGLNDFEHDA
jgi:curved DNA-binding protein CbpA